MLLVRCKPRMSRLRANVRERPQHPDWQHIGIGPITGPRVLGPACGILELVFDSDWVLPIAAVPNVPDVIRNAPHLCQFSHLCVVLHGCRPRREAQNDVTTAVLDSE